MCQLYLMVEIPQPQWEELFGVVSMNVAFILRISLTPSKFRQVHLGRSVELTCRSRRRLS